MSERELPDIVFNLELLVLDYQAKKHCTCEGANIRIDGVNRLVHCGECGAVLEPFEALKRVAQNYEAVRKDTEHLLAQRKQIASYKPHLVTIKRIEQHYRGRKMLPVCPHCREAFYLEELTSWTNAEMVERRRKIQEQNNQT